MAEKDRNDASFIAAASKANKQARDSFEFDLQRRLGDQAKILSADDLSGLYDQNRQLFTTIDGQPRPLTYDDLLAFRAAVRDVKRRSASKAYRGGIKPRQVIDLSRMDDRDRAQKEIHTAMPVAARGGTVHFQTNSGPNSDVARHHVYVQFLDYNAAVASPVAPAKIAKEMLRGNVKFDCDCGRHTFWYRFISTIGGFNFGRAEDGFPRVRNPKLYGVACKHVLRVMTMALQSPTLLQYASRMIENGRKSLTDKRKAEKIADMREFEKQLKAERSRQRKVETSEERKAKRALQPAEQRKLAERQARQAAAAQKMDERAQRAAKAKQARETAQALKGARANIEKLAALGAITQQQAATMLAALKG